MLKIEIYINSKRWRNLDAWIAPFHLFQYLSGSDCQSLVSLKMIFKYFIQIQIRKLFWSGFPTSFICDKKIHIEMICSIKMKHTLYSRNVTFLQAARMTALLLAQTAF